MSKIEKLLARFKKVPSDLTWDEFAKVIGYHGYELAKGNGLRRKFINPETGHSMSFHEPHPESIMKKCYIREVIRQFDEKNIWLEQENNDES